MRWRVSRSILVAAFAVTVFGCAPVATVDVVPDLATEVGPDPLMRETASDAMIDDVLDAAKPGCSAAVAVHGEVVWAGAKGVANLETGEALTTSTRFDMASVSKQFTATAILMLQREGLISLSDPIATYVDGLPRWGKTITLEQLMHHTSHVPDYWKQLDVDGIKFTDPASQAQVLQAIREVAKLEPKTGYLYSNSNYVLLAAVVETVSGQSLPEFLDSRIFTPLGLDMELVPGLQAPDVALSYDDNDLRVVSGWVNYGHSEIYSTATELARWADQYRAGDIIADDFAAGAVDTTVGDQPSTGVRYAAGININKDGSLRHDGRFGGHTTTFQISPDRETAVVVMCNGHLAPRFGIANELWAIWGSELQGD
jgi:CubicO group peptidase (beta-lactamase class C family)